MDKPIDPAVQERLRARCRQFTVAYDLDPEIQEELYGHMEDKLLAYLGGDEKPSQEDAIILVDKHFGDPAKVKALLQDVHDRSVGISLARRLTAALVVSLAFGMAANILYKTTVIALALWSVQSDEYKFFYWAGHAANFATGLASAALLWYVLVRWQRRLSRGEETWFVRWSARRMWTLATVTLIAPLFIPGVLPALHDKTPIPNGTLFIFVLASVEVIPALLNACAWLWWSDRRPRVPKGILQGAIAWASTNAYLGIAPRLAPTMVLGLPTLMLFGKPAEGFAHGTFFGTELQWSLIWFQGLFLTPADPLHFFMIRVSGCILGMSVGALVAWAIYRSVNYAMTRIALHNLRRQVIA